MVEHAAAGRETPSTADPVDEDHLFRLLHAHLADPGHDGIDDLVRAHPEHGDALRTLYADYQLAHTVILERAGSDRHSRVVDQLGRAAAGQRPYEDLGLLAHGGMAEIRRVRDSRLQRNLVKKVLPVSIHAAALDARLVRRLARFLGEAHTMSGLHHPAILTVVDFGLDERGRPFLVMPEVEGRTLAEVFAGLARSTSAFTTAVHVVQTLLPACEAVAYAHACGVVHRDLKPANVMVGRFGEVRVMDWGLAKRLGAPELASRDGSDELPASWTRTGDHVGTPAYMAPEQARGERDAIGPHTDQYALGAILYEGLTGRRPYADQLTSSTSRAMLDAIRTSLPTSIDRLTPSVPAELAAIVGKAMARAPTDRYPTVAALVDDLRAFLDLRVVAAYGSGPWHALRKWIARHRGLTLGAVGMGVTLIAALTALNLLQASHRVRLQATNLALEGARREAVDNFAGLQGHLYRQQLAAALRQYEDGGSTAVIGAALDECPPHLRGFEWRLLAALGDGGAPLARCDTNVTGLALTPDGTTFAAGGRDRVEVWDLPAAERRYTRETLGWVQFVALDAGTELLAVTTANGYLQVWDLPSGAHLWDQKTQIRSPLAFSAGGRRLYCVLQDHALAVLDALRGEVLATHAHDGQIERLAVGPFGNTIAVAGLERTLLLDVGPVLGSESAKEPRTQPLSGVPGDRLRDREPSSWVAERWAVPHAREAVAMLQFELDGRSLYVGLNDGRYARLRTDDGSMLAADRAQSPAYLRGGCTVWRGRLVAPHNCWLTLGTSPPLPLSGHPDRLTSHAVHPTQPWLLSGSLDGEVRLWSARAPRVRSVLRGHGEEILTVALSPDATRVAATGWDPEVWVWDLVTGRPVLRIPASAEPKRALAWTRDGQGLLAVGTDGRLHEFDAGTGASRRRFALAVGWASPLALSPSGARALSVDRQNQVVVVDFATDTAQRIGVPMRVCAMAWAPDGNEFYVNDREALHRFDAGTLSRTASLGITGLNRLIASPDGQHLVCSGASRVVIVARDSFSVLGEALHTSFTGGAFASGEARIVTATEAGQVQILDAADGKSLLRVPVDRRGAQTADLSADGRVFVLAGLSGEVTCLRVPGAAQTPR